MELMDSHADARFAVFPPLDMYVSICSDMD